MHTVDIVVVCVAGLALLGCILVLARQRFMLRAVGTIPVALRTGSRWQYGVARYAGNELRWYRSLGLGTRPSRTLRRADMTVLRSHPPEESELAALPTSVVVVECTDRGADVSLALGEGAYTGFVSWIEASAPAT